MTKNRSMRLAVLVLALALITCCFVGSTFAKYTSTASGSDTVSVAKWAVKAGASGAEASITGDDPEVTFDLFATINDTDDNTETDVVAEKIAPGTKGSFTLSVVNESEVTVDYVMTFDFSDFDELPITFKVAGQEATTANGTLDYDGKTDGTTSATVLVEWEWVIGDGSTDSTDTTIGINADSYQNLEASVELVVNQKD